MRNTCCVLNSVVWLLISAQAAGEVMAEHTAGAPIRSFSTAVPSNDSLANALKVNAQPLWIHTTSNQGASMEAGEAALRHGGDANAAASIWYTWSVRERVEVLVDTAGSTFATAIGVYTGTAIPSLTPVAGASSSVLGRDAWVRFTAEPNVSYKIAIAGIPPTPLGSVTVRFEVHGQPDVAPPLMEISRPSSGSTVRDARVRIEGVVLDPQPNGAGVREVQYSLDVEGNSIIRAAQGTTNFVALVDLQPGLNGVTLWAYDNADNRSAQHRLSIFYSPTISTNDLFVHRFVLDPRVTSRTDSNSGATREPGEPAHAGNPGGASIWYEFVAEESGVLLLSTFGSSFDTVLAVYGNGSAGVATVTNLVELGSSDDVPGGTGHSELTVTVERGKRYFIAVDGFDGRVGTVFLTYRFSAVRVVSLTVLGSTGEGTVSPGSGAYPENATVSLLARPAEGWEFDYFESPSGALRQNPLTLLMAADATVRAVFRARAYAEDFEGGFSFDFESSGWSIGADPTNSANHVLAASGAGQDRITNRVTVTLQATEGIGAFDFGVSCETNYDRLEFFIGYLQNGVEVSRTLMSSWSGEARGRHLFALRAGTVRLEWRYVKDAAISDGRDLAFIDNIDLPLFRAQPEVAVANETVTLQVKGLGTQALRVEISPDLSSWSFLMTVSPNGAGEVRMSEPAAGATRFYRFTPVLTQGGSAP